MRDDTQGPFLIHVAGVMAVWLIFLSSIRFAHAGFYALHPAIRAAWCLWRCKADDRRTCRYNFNMTMDRMHDEFFIAFVTPWSVSMLYGGMGLIGAGLACGSVGDVAQLVSRHPSLLNAFDRLSDCVGALLMCTGMALVLAALSKRRRLSTAISLGFALTGLGVGIVTAV